MVRKTKRIKEDDIYYHPDSNSYKLGNKHYVIDDNLDLVSEVELKKNEKFDYVDVTKKDVGKMLLEYIKNSKAKKNDNKNS